MSSPPRLAAWLMRVSTVEADRQAVVGDLIEEFNALTENLGASGARRWFWRQALTSLLPNVVRRLREPRLPGFRLPILQAPRLPGSRASRLRGFPASRLFKRTAL